MSLARWDPFRNVERQMLERFFGPTWRDESWQGSAELASWTPAVDAQEKDGAIHVLVELPGVEMKDVDVTLENNVLTISGERRSETNKEGEPSYHWRERVFGRFQRSFTLPASVDRDKVAASYKDGVLQIVVPKKAEAKPRQIAIKAA